MINFTKNKVKKSKLFWTFRHLVQRRVWSDYYNTYSTDRRVFYSKIVSKYKCKTIFEFGCASGPNLKSIETQCSGTNYYFGYDINKAAIDFALKRFNPTTSFFSTKLSTSVLESKLHSWGFTCFDLAIYDRVLCLLSEREVNDHFSRYQQFFENVIIDDFYNPDFKDHNEAYSSKNYRKILLKYGFNLIADEKSEHEVRDAFFDRSARRLFFRR